MTRETARLRCTRGAVRAAVGYRAPGDVRDSAHASDDLQRIVSTALPTIWPASSAPWASAACSSGNVAPTSTRRSPASKCDAACSRIVRCRARCSGHPNTDGAGIQANDTRRLRLCMAAMASSSHGLSTFETRSP
jgi:hypothetical protein